MAQKVSVQLVDDLDGGEAEETIEFGLDGVNYTIDLSGDNASGLRDGLAQFVHAAQRVGGRKKRSAKREAPALNGTPRAQTPASREQTQAIREWARKNNYKVSDRGRIPGDIVEAFEKAQGPRRRG